MPARNGNKPATQAQLKTVKNVLKRHIDKFGKTLKGDIKALGTELKGDISRLDQKIDRVAVEVAKHTQRFDSLEETLCRDMSENTSRIMTAINDFAMKAEAYGRKAFSHGDIIQNHEAKLRNHDRRLAALESKT